MNSHLRLLGVLAASVLCASPLAQPQQQTAPPPRDPGATLADRVLVLEREVARLTTAFDLREAERARAGDFTLTTRVERLEQSLDRLAIDLQRVSGRRTLRTARRARRAATQKTRSALRGTSNHASAEVGPILA